MVDKVEGQSSESGDLVKPIDHQSLDPSHPTGRMRYSEKKPPMHAPGDASEKPSDSKRGDAPVFESEQDHDMEYSPTEPPDPADIEMPDAVDPSHDSSTAPMDLSGFLAWLSPPPEELVRKSSDRSGLVCPIFVPNKDAGPLTSTPMSFCNTTIHLVEPSMGISEDGLTRFDSEKVKAGRLIELQAMNSLQVGQPLRMPQAQSLAKELGIRIIPCRWVLTAKTVEGMPGQCRARCVAQEIASGSASAQSLGISSTTPSVETFRCFLSMIQHHDMHLEGLDISTAFLNSELPAGVRAIVKLPSDCSFESTHYEGVYLDLYKSMNGLRVASKSWLQSCTRILTDKVNLVPCMSEPTVLCGMSCPSNAPVIVMIYVDDLLVGSVSKSGIADVRGALQETLKVKVTGTITKSNGAGGTIVFLGRHIIRPAGSQDILLRVPPSYLEDLFVNDPFCCELRSSDVPPDLLSILEKGIKDPSCIELLTEEASSRYKRIIGKLSWWAQSRPDQARFLSILATGQATPSNLHEHALRRYLRYVRSHLHLFQKFPSGNVVLPELDGLTGISDASWGSSDLEKRRSTSGGLVFWQGSLVKGYSRLQGCITLSSCEAEIIAVCQLAQECLGIRHVTEFLESFGDRNMLLRLTSKEYLELRFDESGNLGDHHPIVIFTDSQACIGALSNQGLSRRVRHMSISVRYIQALRDCGHLVLEWLPGTKCTADLLTKVLPIEANNYHRSQLGIVEVLGQEEWQVITTRDRKKQSRKSDVQTAEVQDDDPHAGDLSVFEAKKSLSAGGLDDFKSFLSFVGMQVKAGIVTHIIVELCTTFHAGLSQGANAFNTKCCVVIPVTQDIDIFRVGKLLRSWLVQMNGIHPKALVLGWSSPPCTGGSPVLNLIPQPKRSELQKGHLEALERILGECHPILKICDVRVLEMSQRCSYWREELVQSFCRFHGLESILDVARCAYVNDVEKAPALHRYRFACSMPMFQPKICHCESHMSLNDQHLSKLGEYPKDLAIDVVKWFITKGFEA